MNRVRLVPLGAILLVLAGCVSVSDSATYEARMGYLRKIAGQGAETHHLLQDQDAPKIDKERCSAAWSGLRRYEDFPLDRRGSNTSQTWDDQIKEFFVDSYVSGKPKPVPGEPPASTTPSVSEAPLPFTGPSTSVSTADPSSSAVAGT